MDKKGWVCVLEVDEIGHLRIMKTKKDPAARAKELLANTSEDPDIIHEVHVSDCDAVKKAVCNEISHRRVGRKDIFRVDSEYVISSLNMLAERYPVYAKNEEENEQPDQGGDVFGGLMFFAFFAALIAIVYGLLISLPP